MHETFMDRAVEVALGNIRAGAGGPFGALIVHRGQPLAEGVNLVTSSMDPTAHAEIVAIRRACQTLSRFWLKDCELYTTCEPCPMCFGAIYWSHIERLYYACTRSDAAAAGFDDSFIYDQVYLSSEKRSIPMRQLGRDNALGLFQEWKAKIDRVPY